MPVALDAAQADSLLEALRVQYRQMMRWAWAVSNLPFIADQWRSHSEIPLARKLEKCLPYLEGLLIIPSSWFVITFGAVLPPLLNPAVPTQIVGIPVTLLAPLILAPTALGFIVVLALNLRVRHLYSPRHAPFTLRQRIGHTAEWLAAAGERAILFRRALCAGVLAFIAGERLAVRSAHRNSSSAGRGESACRSSSITGTAALLRHSEHV